MHKSDGCVLRDYVELTETLRKQFIIAVYIALAYIRKKKKHFIIIKLFLHRNSLNVFQQKKIRKDGLFYLVQKPQFLFASLTERSREVSEHFFTPFTSNGK